MAEAKNKAYRLFKVAKELNVGSSTLVDHLLAHDFEVKNHPNEKLTPEMYEVLLKEYSSEKILKEKVEEIREKKKEKSLAPDDAVIEEEEEFISADRMRSEFLSDEVKTTKKQTTNVPPPVEPVVEKTPEKETPVKKEESSETGKGLKVLGKISLDKPTKKVKVQKAQTPPVEEVKEEPKQESKPPEQVDTPEEVVKPVEKVEKEKVEEVPPVEDPKVEVEPVVDKAEAETPEEEKSTEDEVIRAADNAPKLTGLKVMGKIELPASKKPKKVASSTESKGSDDGDGKKKRKRRRKTKSGTSTPGTSTSKGTGPVVKKGGARRTTSRSSDQKKEEPSEKEIQEIIKKTLANIESRAGRTRQRIRRAKRDDDAKRRQEIEQIRADEAQVLEVTEFITANELSNLLEVPVTSIITKCMELGLFVSINQRLEADVISLLAEEYGFTVKFVDVKETDIEDEEEEDMAEDNSPRAPIITVMGHVDHGKTSLLDYIRNANVIAGEAGGITQHIGAYEVTLPDQRQITFLDTPGHEAFTAMRARGAKVTDVVVVVIAADDSVMPQTKEAIQHAEAASVPIVFALNKIDKDGADPEKIKQQLASLNYLVEDWGGKYQCQEISAKAGTGIDELLEKVLLESEMLELKSNPDNRAMGTVVESKLDKGRGIVANLLVQNGTMRIGDCLVAGIHFGRVKALMDERGKRIESAGPSTPVQVLGLQGNPQAGDVFKVYSTEKIAKDLATKRQELYRQQAFKQNKHITLDEIARRRAIGDFKELNIIIKGDVDGSIEALADSLQKISTEEVQVRIVMRGVGQISESDVQLASASEAVIIGFQVRPSPAARRFAETEGIDIRLYSIIYDAINDVKDALEGMLSPEIKEEITGAAEVRDVFKITKVGMVAGCMVVDGKISRNDPVRLIRDGIVFYAGKLASLKRFKDDVKEVREGFECGIMIENYNDLKVGDIIEFYREKEVKRSL